MWQPGWEGGLGRTAYVYMYGWVPLLFIWNYDNSVTGYTPTQNKSLKKNKTHPLLSIRQGLIWKIMTFLVRAVISENIQLSSWNKISVSKNMASGNIVTESLQSVFAVKLSIFYLQVDIFFYRLIYLPLFLRIHLI